MTTKMPKQTEEPEEYQMDYILDQMHNGSTDASNLENVLYLVKWKGYGDQYNTREPPKHLANVPQKLRQWSKLKAARKRNESASKKESISTSTDSDLDKYHNKKQKYKEWSKSISLPQSKEKVKTDKHKQLRSDSKERQARQLSSNLSSANSNKFSQLKVKEMASQKTKKTFLKLKKNVKRAISIYDKAERHIKKNITELDACSDKTFDTNIILSTKRTQKRSQRMSSKMNANTQSTIFQRQEKLLKNLESRKIILEKTDVNGDEDLIIIEESASQIDQHINESKQSSRRSSHNLQRKGPREQQEPVEPVASKQQYQKQTSQKQQNIHDGEPQELFDLSYEQQGEEFILPDQEMKSITPLPNINERYEENLDFFLREPAPVIAVQPVLDYQAMKQIRQMYKIDDKIFCEVKFQDGSVLPHISLADLKDNKPHLLVSFLGEMFPAKSYQEVFK